MACTNIDGATQQELVGGAPEPRSSVVGWVGHAIWIVLFLGAFEWALSAISALLLGH
ncbi:MAG TPA: hypothetical protein VKR31_14560 [Rhizomicrobium sp.]|nr:hypothetical protein [Rhizomicrobium sp.]